MRKKNTIIKAPFLIGDTVFFILYDDVVSTTDIIETTVIDISKEFFRIKCDEFQLNGIIHHTWRPYSEVGSKVFLSRYDAERYIYKKKVSFLS